MEGFLAGKRLSRHKLAKLIPPHTKYVEPFAGNAWALRGCREAKKCNGNAVLNDIRCDVMERTRKNFPDAKSTCGLDYKTVISRHNDKGTFFMLDPPYPNSCKLKMYGKHCVVDHMELRDVVKKIKGKFLLTTSVDQKPRFCNGSGLKCRVITSRGMYGRKLRDLVVTNF